MLECGFFNAVDGDRTYNAETFNDFLTSIMSENGIYKKSGDYGKPLEIYPFQVVSMGDLNIAIGRGRAIVNKHWVNLTSNIYMTLEPSDGLTRYDAIVLRWNGENRNVTIEVIKGTSSDTPEKPPIVRTENIYDLCLAYVKIGPNNYIHADYVTDTREDASLCGWVTLQVDAIQCGVKEYKNVLTTTGEVTELQIGIPEYDAEKDLLFANINGIMFVEGTDYEVSGTGSDAKITTTNTIRANNTIEFRVIKSIVEIL